ncbi:hypothetical protein FNSV3_12280 [Fusobacterium nucleatum]|nr:hypothetical protein FNSV3_12280 [Fusobacterium nucleatum]
MAKYTENIRLAQPEGSDYYDIEVFNHNSELIDKKIGEMDNSLSTIKEGATREKAGIVQLGTEEGKALEGMMLARLAGAYGYGGDIQDEGVKNPNYIYYDRNTRKMYKCLKQNQDISANVANFVPLDNNSLLERLENFSRFEEHLFNIPKLTFGRVTRIANLATLIIDSGQLFYNKNYEVVLNIPENFRPKSTIFFSASYRNTNKSTTFYISPNGDVTKSGVDDDQGAYYFTITYPIN